LDVAGRVRTAQIERNDVIEVEEFRLDLAVTAPVTVPRSDRSFDVLGDVTARFRLDLAHARTHLVWGFGIVTNPDEEVSEGRD
jgi:hypothetical protein